MDPEGGDLSDDDKAALDAIFLQCEGGHGELAEKIAALLDDDGGAGDDDTDVWDEGDSQ